MHPTEFDRTELGKLLHAYPEAKEILRVYLSNSVKQRTLRSIDDTKVEDLDFADEGERYAEIYARQLEDDVKYTRENLLGWLDKMLQYGWTVSSLQTMTEIVQRAQDNEQAANSLRRPRWSRKEQDSYRKAGM